MCAACDVEELAWAEDWPSVVDLALREMLMEAPSPLVQAVMTALDPLAAWWRDNEEVVEAARAVRAAVTAEEKRQERERWLAAEEKRLAPIRADEAAHAEHLRQLAIAEGRVEG
jgi:hypothetical protein